MAKEITKKNGSNQRYTPIQNLLIALSDLSNKSGLSLREISRKAEKEGLNLYNICSMANGNPAQMATVVKYDQYVDAILRITGHDEEDLLKKALGISETVSPSYSRTLPKEIRDFLKDQSSEKYLVYAYQMYRKDKITKELEEINKKLEEDM